MSHSRFSIAAMMVFMALARNTSSSSTTSETVSSPLGSTNHVLMLPLIPHHIQKQRRMQELGMTAEEWSAIEEEWDSTTNLRSNGNGGRRRRHRRGRRTEAVQVGALYHGYGTHYADVWVGTPPQRQTLIVDTGSGLTAFPCTGCDDCGGGTYHIDDTFQETQSSTFEQVACGQCRRGTCRPIGGEQKCQISMSYQEGSSWHAYEAQDTCYVGGPHTVALTQDEGTEDIDPRHARHFAFPLRFGCQYKLTGLFLTQLADGIMGMEDGPTTFWRQMFDAGKMGDEKKFALCFSRPPYASRSGTSAGAMAFGGVEKRLHDTDMVFTKRGTSGGGWFAVEVRAIYLRDGSGGPSAKVSGNVDAQVIDLKQSIEVLNEGGVIVDSGTTDTYFNKDISAAFVRAFKELTGRTYNNNKVTLTKEELASLPTILFQLVGDVELNQQINADPSQVVGLAGDLDAENPYDVIVALPASSYMEQDGPGIYVGRFYTDEDSGSVLGANTMLGHDVLFDASNAMTGWAESKCDYQSMVLNGGFTSVLGGTDVQVEGSRTSTENQDEQEEVNATGEIGSSNVDSQSEQDSSFSDSNTEEETVNVGSKCDSVNCRFGLTFALFLILACLGYCLHRAFGRRGLGKVSYQLAELELTPELYDKTFRDEYSVDKNNNAEDLDKEL